jgi:hypothetical protein
MIVVIAMLIVAGIGVIGIVATQQPVNKPGQLIEQSIQRITAWIVHQMIVVIVMLIVAGMVGVIGIVATQQPVNKPGQPM